MLLSLFAFAFRSAVNPEVLSSVPPLSVKGIWRPSEVAHIIRMVDAPIAVIAQRVSQGIGDFGRIGGGKCGCVCYARTLAGRARTEQELRAALIAVMRWLHKGRSPLYSQRLEKWPRPCTPRRNHKKIWQNIRLTLTWH